MPMGRIAEQLASMPLVLLFIGVALSREFALRREFSAETSG
jgi:hypothetical protein